MKHFNIAAVWLTILVLALMPKLSYAIEPLSFSSDIGFSAKQRLGFFLQSADAARIDLNGDDRPEYVLQDKACNADILCEYQVLAFSKDTVLRLARFQARKVVISDEKTHGVRNLIVYNHPVDDFKATPFVWDFRKTQYVESF